MTFCFFSMACTSRDRDTGGNTNWSYIKTQKIENRIISANANIIEAARNIGQSPSVKMPQQDKGITQDLSDALKELPSQIKEKFEKIFFGVALVEGLGATGMSIALKTQTGEVAGGYILLDVGTLKYNDANTWHTWKENSPFDLDKTVRLETQIAAKASNHRKYAIQYILLHELGHIYDFYYKISSNSKLFKKPSWSLGSPVYYGNGKENKDKLLDYYSALQQSDYPTLYATLSAQEDWAESFAQFVHTEMLKKPFKIAIYEQNRAKLILNKCWDRGVCQYKYNFLKEELGERKVKSKAHTR